MENEPSRTLAESDVYALLAHRRRRLLLRLLEDFVTPLSTEELAELIADCEYESPTDHDREHVLRSVSHTHLPELSEAAVVAYDPECGTVRTGPNFGVLVGVLAEQSGSNGPFADDDRS